MNNVHQILPILALVLAVGGIIRPAWPLIAVSVMLLAIDQLTR